MPAAAIPENEDIRVQSLKRLRVLDTAAEAEFDAIVKAASLICGVPISLISLVDINRQWFKANVGLEGVTETPRELAFCAHAILGQEILEVEDATKDVRFSDNPLVLANPNIRFYAGAPLQLTSGENVGTLCVIDTQPHKLSDQQLIILTYLATAASKALESHRLRESEQEILIAEAALLEAADYTASIFQNTKEPIIALMLDGTITHWNAAAQKLFGYTHEEMLGENISRLVPFQNTNDDAEIVLHIANLPEGISYESKRLSKLGELIDVSVSLAPLYNGSGRLIGATKIVHDIREQNQTRRLLAASEAKYRALSDASPLGVFATDASGICTYTNTRWQDIFGISFAESLGSGWSNTIHLLDREAVYEEWQRSASERIEFDMEFRIRHEDGTIRYVHSRSRPVIDESDNIISFVGSVEDVTFRKQQEDALVEANARVAIATKSGGIGIWSYDVLNDRLECDDTINGLYGLTSSDVLTVNRWASMLHPDDREDVVIAFNDAIAGNSQYDVEFRAVRHDGSIHHIRAKASVTRDSQDKALHMLGTNWDVTKLRELTLEVSKQHETLRVTLQSIGDAVITTDAKGRITWLNPVAERMTGWLSAEAKGRPIAQIFNILNEVSRKVAENPVAECLRRGKIVGLANHTILISRDGIEYGIEDSASPIRSEDGRIIGVVLVFHDVTEQRRLSNEMSYRATHDSLTGLVNRAEFETRLSRVLSHAKAEGGEHSLMFIDLDQFKLVNDACGHSAGDILLQQVTKMLSEIVRSRDTLARLGGDEFGVILEQCSTEQAQRVAQTICDRMDEYRFIHDGKRFRIGTSIGLTILDGRWAGIANVIQAADAACYTAKEAGRNRVHTWFDTDASARTHQGEMQWATRLELALDENQFELFAQRIFVVDKENLSPAESKIHAEVLLRLRDDDGVIISPGAFLPAAERFHLASRVDRWVLEHVIDWLDSLQDISQVSTICVNLSGQSIGDRAFHTHAIETLRKAGKEICECICLEITETATVTNIVDASIFIEQVRQLGVRIALDDFGAGASSFGYLKTLKVDMLKIDGQFIKAMIRDPLDDSAVRCFIDVARIMGLKTVAEYVESPEILAHVRSLGINYAQGYLMHEPHPIDALVETYAVQY
ncbi:PAS domain S-box protein [Methylotenera sp.]|uniref:PAS domain S-box protein n=1 Tax=Methylotenera sp. TaxID=2051956 RepID=UPI0024878D8B|nr:PAS domain S-box protein [Methylotenera sp.]MDI1362710.1 PAS domain S-box protein [Methylotenera sp.]